VRTLLVLLSIYPLLGQAPDRQTERQRLWLLVSNAMRNVKTTIQLDRKVYYPQEESILEISVENTSGSTVEIPDPFSEESGGLSLYRISEAANGQKFHESLLPHPPVHRYSEERMPNTIILQPHQSLKLRVRTPAECGFGKTAFMKSCLVPAEAGHYAWVYNSIPPAMAEFEIYNPEVVEFADLSLTKLVG
jgi:hypothetical protein